jgi:hypothetical protein
VQRGGATYEGDRGQRVRHRLPGSVGVVVHAPSARARDEPSPHVVRVARRSSARRHDQVKQTAAMPRMQCIYRRVPMTMN